MPRSYKAKPSATGRLRSAKGQATATAASARKGTAKGTPKKVAGTKATAVKKAALRRKGSFVGRRTYRDSR